MSRRIRLCLVFAFGTLAACAQQRVNDSLRRVLDTVGEMDEIYRDQIEDVTAKYGAKSVEAKALFERMRVQDSIDQVNVAAILDRFGWVGKEVLGDEDNSALFFVIQHAELPFQLKYLPMIRAAVRDGKAKPRHLALLEDRIALRQGRKQVYGSQVAWDMRTNKYYVLPVEDPDHVDQRRAAVGLPSLAIYLQNWQTTWDVGQYKRDLPLIDSLWRGLMPKGH